LRKEGKDIKYPDYETLKKESDEPESFLLFTIADEEGNIVRKIKQPITKGINKLVWDFRYSPVVPVTLKPFDSSIPWASPDLGYMVPPGNYQVSLSKFEQGEMTQIAGPQTFKCKPLNITTIPPEDQASLDKFNKKVAKLSRAISAANAHKNHIQRQFPYLEQAILSVPSMQEKWFKDFLEIKEDLKKINIELNGDPLISRYEGAARTSLKNKIDLITGSLWSTTSGQTSTFERAYSEAEAEFEQTLKSLKALDGKINQLEMSLEKAGAPYTPGRFSVWQKN
jgi:hypothetical protein